jgi:hypothetical protein
MGQISVVISSQLAVCRGTNEILAWNGDYRFVLNFMQAGLYLVNVRVTVVLAVCVTDTLSFFRYVGCRIAA